MDLLGISYGTTLMSTYATLYPQHTDRLILDPPSTPARVERTPRRADTGYQARITDLFTWIADHDSIYRLGRTPLACVTARGVASSPPRRVCAPSVSPPPARVGDVPPGLRSQVQAYIAGQNLTGPGRAQAENFSRAW